MALIHELCAYTTDGKIQGVSGIQSGQRDFSPYLIHFTSYAAMANLRNALKDKKIPTWYKDELAKADQSSAQVFKKILASKHLKPSTLSSVGANYTLPFVCLTECTLPGILSHSERFGRFGIIFDKEDLFKSGARPCLYLEGSHYAVIKGLHENKPSKQHAELYHLACNYKPTLPGIQDFTHEREWRHFGGINFGKVAPRGYVVPSRYLDLCTPHLQAGQFVLPIDVLFEMGV